MVRLTRAQQQERTLTAVLTAATAEFSAHGYVEAKVDRIAERAELTRGAVYSNFPSKRALYLAVLVDMVEHSVIDEVPSSSSPAEALGAFARVWLERLPLADALTSGRLRPRSLAGVLEDESTRTVLAQVARLEAILLALALESCVPAGARRVRQVRRAELALTLLNGSGHLADTAPGFGDLFDVAHACEHLGSLDLGDTWNPPHVPHVARARSRREPWIPPTEMSDQITARRVGFDEDGVIVILGANRLGAAEEAVRAARPGNPVTVAVVTGDPAEIGRLVRLRIGDITRCLRRVFPSDARPRLRLVLDDCGVLAAAVGVPDVDDATEHAVRIHKGELVARAHGRGAAHAAATAGDANTTRSKRTRT